jgi:RNA polymerase sigma-70 factor, ECF subfamily
MRGQEPGVRSSVEPADGHSVAERRPDRSRAEEGFAGFFRTEYPSVARTVELILRDRGRAEEVTQDAFIQLFTRWRRISKYERPGAWVRRVAIRMAVRALVERNEPSQVEDAFPDVDLVAAIHTLPETQRAVIVLFYFEDLPVAEIAHILERPEATIRSDLHRARNQLADLLDEPLGGDGP